MAYKCFVIELPYDKVFAYFEKDRFDIDSKEETIIINYLNTNHDGEISYALTKTDGSSAEEIATIDEDGLVTIKKGAKGHIIITANISRTEENDPIILSYKVDVYKLYKAGEELDVEKQDYNGYKKALYSPYWQLTKYKSENFSVRKYKVPEVFFTKKTGWVISGAKENFPDSDVVPLSAVNFNVSTNSLGGDTTDDGTICKNADLVSLQKSGYGNKYSDFASSGSNEGKFVYYPAENYLDFKIKYLILEAPVSNFENSGVYLTISEDFKDYGD